MAAGQGFKTFTTGEVLTAGDVNGYLMQGINVFTNATARDAAITAPAEGQFAFTKDNNSLWYYDGAAWVASGATGDIEGVTAGVGISGGGTSGTVTVTNSMATAIDAKGDLVPGTGADTFARLAVGANNTVLTADSAEATGLKWAAPAASGLNLVKRATFSNVANTSTTFDGVFTSTYKSYLINFEYMWGTNADDAYFQFRYAGPTTQASGNSWMQMNLTGAPAVTSSAANPANQIQLGRNMGLDGYETSGQFYIYNVGYATTERPSMNGVWNMSYANEVAFTSAWVDTDRIYTGFILSASANNIYGTVSVYGLAAA